MTEEIPKPPKRRYFSGKTVEQALVLAARYHHLSPESIAYRRLEKRHGFLKVARRVLLEVDPERPLKEAGPPQAIPQPVPAAPIPPSPPIPAPAPERRAEPRAEARAMVAPPMSARPAPERTLYPTPEREPRRPVSDGELLETARTSLDLILRLASLDLAAEVRVQDGVIEVDLSGHDRSLLLEDEAELLQAIEYLLPRALGELGGEGVQCRVDSEGFRSGREEELKELALRTAATVKSTGNPEKLAPLSPSERRVVHMALAEDPEITTESEGDSHFKRVTIRRA